jgi:hypothetical protein
MTKIQKEILNKLGNKLNEQLVAKMEHVICEIMENEDVSFVAEYLFQTHEEVDQKMFVTAKLKSWFEYAFVQAWINSELNNFENKD